MKKLIVAFWMLTGSAAFGQAIGPGVPSPQNIPGIQNAEFYAKAYGSCAWGANGNNSSCIQSAITAAAANGGGTVVLPCGTFGIATTIEIHTNGVGLRGCGVGSPRDSFTPLSFQAETLLTWTGGAATRALDVSPTVQSSLSNNNIDGFAIECNDVVDRCVDLQSLTHSIIRVGGGGAIKRNISFTALNVTYGPGFDDNDVWAYSRDVSTINTPVGIFMDKEAGGLYNVSYNRFHQLLAWYRNGEPMVFGSTDNNVIYDIRTYMQPAATEKPVALANTGYVTTAGETTSLNSRANQFHKSGAVIKAFGTVAGQAANANWVWNVDTDNAIPVPTCESQALIWYTTTANPFPISCNNAVSKILMGNGTAFVLSTNIGFGSNIVSGSYAGVVSGVGNIASGYASWVTGQNNVASGFFGRTHGQWGTDRGRYGVDTWANGRFAAVGDAQTGHTILRGTTTGASALRLTADAAAAGATNCINIPVNATFNITATVTMWDATTTTKKAAWGPWTMMLSREAGSANLATGTKPTPLTAGTVTGIDIAATADTTNQCLNLSFTPPTGNTDTLRVVADVVSSEVQ